MIKKNILLNEFLSINFTISTDYETFKSMLFSSLKSLKEIEIKTFTVIKDFFTSGHEGYFGGAHLVVYAQTH